jgi:hypothetical protein
MRFKDVEHLFRLAAVFLVGILVFLVARATLVPDDFGLLGHYRAGAVSEVAARPIAHAGQKACAECHADVVETRAAARHAAIACESCHGPLAKHADGSDAAKPARPDGRATCIRCHATRTGKPTRYPRVDVQEHAGDEKCVTCHSSHNPKIG